MDRYRYFEMDVEERRRIIDRIVETLKERDDVLLAIIFGSFVELPEFRDIDIAVYVCRRDVLKAVIGLANILEERLGIPVDVVPLDYLPTRFRHYVLTKGVVILEKAPGLYEALLSQTIDELLLESLYA